MHLYFLVLLAVAVGSGLACPKRPKPTATTVAPTTTTCESTEAPISTTTENPECDPALKPSGDCGDCPCGWSQAPFEGNCYFYETVNLKNFSDAEAECVCRGGHLASIHSLEEAQFIVADGNLSLGDFQKYDKMTWIGGYRNVPREQMFWTDGTEVTYNETSSVNFQDQTSLCIQFFSDDYRPSSGENIVGSKYKFHDSGCSYEYKYVCKTAAAYIPPEPAK